MTTKDIQQVLLNAPSANVNGRKVLTHDGKHYGSYDHLRQELERQSRVAGQKNTMQALSSGQGIPLKSAGTGSNIGTGYGAKLNGRQVVVVPGGWKNVPTGSLAEYEGNNWGYGKTIAEGINVAGQTLFPMQRGDDLIFVPRGDSEPTLIEQQYGINTNVPQVTPPTRARDAALEEMAQQYDPNYWDRKENEAIRAATLADADRTDGTVRVTSDMEGYEDRADIQAWLAANPGLKDQFLADRARKAEAGLLQENPNLAAENYSPTGAPGFGGDDINWIEALYGDRPAQENAAENYSPLGGPLGEDVDWLGTGEQAAAEEVANQLAQQRQRQVIENFLGAAEDYPAGS